LWFVLIFTNQTRKAEKVISRFFSEIEKEKVLAKTILIMTKALIPGLFVTTAFFEICEIYNYSSLDSLIVLVAMIQIMNLKFYYGIRDFGSWAEIGMSIAFFVISNLIGLMEIITFSGVKCIFLMTSNKSKYESLKSEPEGILPSDQNIELVFSSFPIKKLFGFISLCR